MGDVAQRPMNLSNMQLDELLRAQLNQDFYTFVPQWKDVNDFIMPSRGRFFITDFNRGERRNLKIFDNTAYLGVRTASAGMMSGITSPSRDWKKLTTQDPDLAESSNVKEWLGEVDKRMSSYFLRSNLYNVQPNVYTDMIGFATGGKLMEEDKDTVSRFESIPIGMYKIAKDRRGRVNVFMRDFPMTVRQIVEKFGPDAEKNNMPPWSNISLPVRNLWDKGHYETWIEVCQIIQPNSGHKRGNPFSKFKKFSSRYFERGMRGGSLGAMNLETGIYLRESGYDYFPFLAPRWQVTGSDVYGTDCPGFACLGDVKQLQHAEKRIAQAIDKLVNPPMTASSDLRTSKSSLISGDITYLEGGANSFFKPAHEIKIDLSHIEAKQQQIRDRINEALYKNLFLMLENGENGPMTATEVAERKEEKLLALGPVLEQMNEDDLDPMIDIEFFLMNKQGLIPPPPQELQGQALAVKYTSVMAQAQKLVGVSALDSLLGMATRVININPQSAAKFDLDEYVDIYADSLGTDQKIIRSQDQVEEIRDQQQKAQAAQQQLQAVNTASSAAKNLAQSPMDQDNALNRLSQHLTGQGLGDS